jgi:lipoyl(octanoyl) transferase
MRRSFTAKFLGRVPYAEAHALQQELVSKRIAKEIGDTILFLEHPPVITLGRGADHADIIASKDLLAELGVDVHETGRGGQVTYHAPGQLVAYPILDLNPDRCDVRKYVRDLCEVMIRLAAEFGIAAGKISDDPKKLGVWVDLESPKEFHGEDPESLDLGLSGKRFGKIGAVGVRLSRWVTMHGIAFNATTDLKGFSLIVPCGMRDHGVSSLQSLGVDSPDIESLAKRALVHFENIFEADSTWVAESHAAE